MVHWIHISIIHPRMVILVGENIDVSDNTQ